ncbi:type II secretion system F family protein [Candidatus Pacearchaeota archaeon]|nr:type II secretion system F family protein [Candidatus Pacearchaeota archaeon]
MIKIGVPHIVAIVIGLIMVGIAFLFLGTTTFPLIIGAAIIISSSPFVISMINETRVENEKEAMFLEFARNLVESVKTGTPVSKSIINVKNKPYGVLTKHIEKLSNQITLGIPLSTALTIFAKDVNNKTITRAITLIGQAEKAGGDIGEILEAVAGAVNTSDKLKKERKAAISTLVIQGYIIFIVFIAIIIVMQFRILPMLSGIAEVGTLGDLGGGVGEAISASEIAGAFLYLLLVQGFFSGLTIGQLSEGDAKAGIKHSFALMILAFVVSATTNTLFGGGL